mmetsp:Transcript_121904/g.390103  ORF Transcript_121904/g.390103 Transcript_121904/m.390103 type:complete len:294 (+) Transcript_121904:134-1015(+)
MGNQEDGSKTKRGARIRPVRPAKNCGSLCRNNLVGCILVNPLDPTGELPISLLDLELGQLALQVLELGGLLVHLALILALLILQNPVVTAWAAVVVHGGADGAADGDASDEIAQGRWWRVDDGRIAHAEDGRRGHDDDRRRGRRVDGGRPVDDCGPVNDVRRRPRGRRRRLASRLGGAPDAAARPRRLGPRHRHQGHDEREAPSRRCGAHAPQVERTVLGGCPSLAAHGPQRQDGPGRRLPRHRGGADKGADRDGSHKQGCCHHRGEKHDTGHCGACEHVSRRWVQNLEQGLP